MPTTRSRRRRSDLIEVLVASHEPTTRPWFRFSWMGVEWSIELADRVALAALADDAAVDGVTLPYAGRVVVWDGAEPQLRAHILFHELMHVACNAHASSHSLARALGCSQTKCYDAEESMVGFVAPLLYGVLVAAGMLTTPAPETKRKPGRGHR